jgi:tetratricopeptide (TPR) repeat protein
VSLAWPASFPTSVTIPYDGTSYCDESDFSTTPCTADFSGDRHSDRLRGAELCRGLTAGDSPEGQREANRLAGLRSRHRRGPGGASRACLGRFPRRLSYDLDNSEYQLSLARALRDTGRLDESQAYLLHLWSATPQDSTVNLALARLAVRRRSLDDAIRYYHSAIYGFWNADPDQNRRQARFELIDFLFQQDALPQAQAELIALTQVLPPDPKQHLQVADLFMRARDLPSAFAQYRAALNSATKNAAALAGAGTAAFQMGHYRTAQTYLQKAIAVDPDNQQAREQLQIAEGVLAADPFLGRLSDAERNRRVVVAFEQAGTRLRSCALAKQVDLKGTPGSSNPAANPSGTDLLSLWSRWQSARRQLRRLSSPSNEDMPDMLMDLVFEIESQTGLQCGEAAGPDRALLLVARNRETADQ